MKKNFITIASIAILAGVFIGVVVCLQHSTANRYVHYEFTRLLLCSCREILNTWVFISGAFTVVILAVYCAVQWGLGQLPARTRKRIGCALAGIVCGTIIVIMLHRNPLIVGPLYLYDAGVLLGVVLLSWCACRADWERLHRFFSTCRVPACAAVAVIALCLLNISLSFYSKFYPQPKPNVILISIDTLRADHLQCYGYQKNTSPHLDAFAKQNILFEDCHVQVPWTLPSHMSMLTSLYPITHGVNSWERMRPEISTLAEYLKNDGYTTIGYVSAYWMNPQFGFQEGFDTYVCNHYAPLQPEKSGEAQNEAIFQQIDRGVEKPFFLFVHYFDVHSDMKILPYDAPPPYRDMFSGDYTGNFSGGIGDITASRFLKHVNKKGIALAESDRDYIAALYDNGLAYMDKCIGDMMQFLKDKKLYDDALIIITSDHGEEFQEHGYMLHSNPYYHEELTHVPLLVKLPRSSASHRSGKRISTLVESIDIMPSILDFLDISHRNTEGQSLLGLIQDTAEGKEYIHGFGKDGNILIMSNTWKLLSGNGLNKDLYKLYNCADDPAENNNLAGGRPAVIADFNEKSFTQRSKSLLLRKKIMGEYDDDSRASLLPAQDNVRVSKEDEDRLKALGYLQ